MYKLIICVTTFISAIILSTVSHSTMADEPLFKATYKGKYSSLNVTMTRTLRNEGSSYYLNSKAKAFAAQINEGSQFQLENGSITANTYAYQRKIFGIKKSESLQFNWENNTALYQKGSTKPTEREIKPGSLDPTLYQLQMQIDVAQNPAQKTFSYTFARRKQTKHYLFEQQAKENIQIGDKTYSALVFKRLDDGDRETRFWLVPELDYAMAKIQHTEEDGDRYEVLLVEYKSSSSFQALLQTKSL